MHKAQTIAELEAELAELKDLDIESKKESKFEKKINDYLKNQLAEKSAELDKNV